MLIIKNFNSFVEKLNDFQINPHLIYFFILIWKLYLYLFFYLNNAKYLIGISSYMNEI